MMGTNFTPAVTALLAALSVLPVGAVAAPPGPLAAPADLQIALDRAGFSPGEIDGKPGANTRRALAEFQRRQRLRSTGALDARTERALLRRAGQLWTTYTIADADAAGPFVGALPEDMMEKASLPALSYVSLVEMLGERFHAAPAFLQESNPGAAFAPGEKIRVPNVGPGPRPPAGKAAKVTISKSGSVARAFDRRGRLIFFAPVTSGSERDPLPLGRWQVRGVARDPVFHYNPDLFWDADEAHAKAKIPAGPNNPVGMVWIDLDKPHYGLHGTPEPSRVGHTQSHGCVRLTNWNALELAALVEVGTPVLFEG